MVPNINRNGCSFRGAGAYHLHDKAEEGREKPTTSARVAWTATRNLVNDDPHLAIDEMWRTAEDAERLKKISGHNGSGRRCDDPVKTMSLSWAPHQSPTREQMESAADSFLKAMGWQEHQALLLAHNDEPQPHLHIILNRVHPETGLTLNDWKDQKRSQRWALAFEKEQGQVLCLARIDKYEKGLDLQPDGMPYPYAKLAEQHERAFDYPGAAEAVQDLTEKDLLARRHQQERETFLASGRAQFRQARQAAYREVRDEHKPAWRDYFHRLGEGRDQLEEHTHVAHRAAVGLAREGDHEQATQVLADLDAEHKTFETQFAAERKALRHHQLEATRERQDEACRALIDQRGIDFQEIKDRQKDERAEFKVLQALRDAGQPHDFARLQELLGQEAPAAAANNNRAVAELLEPANQNRLPDLLVPEANPFMPAARDLIDVQHDPQERGPNRDAADLAVGAMGAAVELGLRLMEGFISPPSPQEQALARARAIREEQLAPEIAAAREEQRMKDEFIRHAATAAREAEAEREHGSELYWEERGRRRTRER